MEIIEYAVFISLLLFGLIAAIFYKPVKQESSYVPEITKCESPIERRLYNGLTQHHIYPVAQYREGVYRIDLAIPGEMIAIEADGKAYHSSPTQKAHDRKKDQYLKSKGWTVLRFSGRKIHRDLPGVVNKIKKHIT